MAEPRIMWRKAYSTVTSYAAVCKLNNCHSCVAGYARGCTGKHAHKLNYIDCTTWYGGSAVWCACVPCALKVADRIIVEHVQLHEFNSPLKSYLHMLIIKKLCVAILIVAYLHVAQVQYCGECAEYAGLQV